jgi:hypothetical protein
MVMENPVLVEPLKVDQEIRKENLSVEILENIIRLLDGKVFSTRGVALKLRIPYEKARRHLFYLWRKGYVLRSKYPETRRVHGLYISELNPVTITLYVYTLNNEKANEKFSRELFITFEEWLSLKREGEI